MKIRHVILIIIGVLLVDQAVKFGVKLNMRLEQDITIFSWLHLHFVENEGMAFGLSLGNGWGKVLLSSFRLVAVGFMAFFVKGLIDRKAHAGFIASIALIMAGAIGNVIDSLFYGLIFSKSTRYEPATLFPEEGGYTSMLYGKVVDMFHCPIFSGHFPDWLPFWGGEYFMFFRPVFNVADASITIGVFLILIFQGRFFAHLEEDKATPSEDETESPAIAVENAENGTQTEVEEDSQTEDV